MDQERLGSNQQSQSQQHQSQHALGESGFSDSEFGGGASGFGGGNGAMQLAANNSSRVTQLKALQAAANNSNQVKGGMAMQRQVSSSLSSQTRRSAPPVQLTSGPLQLKGGDANKWLRDQGVPMPKSFHKGNFLKWLQTADVDLNIKKQAAQLFNKDQSDSYSIQQGQWLNQAQKIQSNNNGQNINNNPMNLDNNSSNNNNNSSNNVNSAIGSNNNNNANGLAESRGLKSGKALERRDSANLAGIDFHALLDDYASGQPTIQLKTPSKNEVSTVPLISSHADAVRLVRAFWRHRENNDKFKGILFAFRRGGNIGLFEARNVHDVIYSPLKLENNTSEFVRNGGIFNWTDEGKHLEELPFENLDVLKNMLEIMKNREKPLDETVMNAVGAIICDAKRSITGHLMNMQALQNTDPSSFETVFHSDKSHNPAYEPSAKGGRIDTFNKKKSRHKKEEQNGFFYNGGDDENDFAQSVAFGLNDENKANEDINNELSDDEYNAMSHSMVRRTAKKRPKIYSNVNNISSSPLISNVNHLSYSKHNSSNNTNNNMPSSMGTFGMNGAFGFNNAPMMNSMNMGQNIKRPTLLSQSNENSNISHSNMKSNNLNNGQMNINATVNDDPLLSYLNSLLDQLRSLQSDNGDGSFNDLSSNNDHSQQNQMMGMNDNTNSKQKNSSNIYTPYGSSMPAKSIIGDYTSGNKYNSNSNSNSNNMNNMSGGFGMGQNGFGVMQQPMMSSGFGMMHQQPMMSSMGTPHTNGLNNINSNFNNNSNINSNGSGNHHTNNKGMNNQNNMGMNNQNSMRMNTQNTHNQNQSMNIINTNNHSSNTNRNNQSMNINNGNNGNTFSNSNNNNGTNSNNSIINTTMGPVDTHFLNSSYLGQDSDNDTVYPDWTDNNEIVDLTNDNDINMNNPNTTQQ